MKFGGLAQIMSKPQKLLKFTSETDLFHCSIAQKPLVYPWSLTFPIVAIRIWSTGPEGTSSASSEYLCHVEPWFPHLGYQASGL